MGKVAEKLQHRSVSLMWTKQNGRASALLVVAGSISQSYARLYMTGQETVVTKQCRPAGGMSLSNRWPNMMMITQGVKDSFGTARIHSPAAISSCISGD